MYRYVALVANPKSESQKAAVSELSHTLCAKFPDYEFALKHDALLVLTAGQTNVFTDHLLRRRRGIVAGSIFNRLDDPLDDHACNPATFGDRETDTIMDSRGQALLTRCWGNYVALIANERSHSVLIVKDPAGSLPCFMARWRDIFVIFSCLQDCIAIGLRFTVNWSYVEARIATNSADLSHEALNEVVQVRRGECLEIGIERTPAITRQFYWQPVSFSEPQKSIDDVDFASKALRATVRSVTRTLAQGHTDIHLQLSGGLDSSIIAGCLDSIAVKTPVTAFTSFSPGGKSDERRWARLSAMQAGFEHIELPIDPTRQSLDPALAMRASVEPQRSLVSVSRCQVEQALADRNSPSAIFSGHGGDSVFGAEAIRHVVDDFLRLKGFSFRALPIAAQVALYADALVWTALKDALVRRFRGSTLSDFRNRMLNKQSLAAAPIREAGLGTRYFPHPWFSDCESVPWHVIRRLGALIFAPEFYSPLHESNASRPIECAPLYSQPVTELSLRIPLHLHFADGVERGLARRAFRTEVPAPILRRLWKDRAPGHFEALAVHNRALLRDIVLGGILAQARLIDCAAVDAILDGALGKGAYFVGELFALFDIELWLRHFS